MKQKLIKDKATEVLTSFFGLDDGEPEKVITVDKFDVDIISDALSQSLTKGEKRDESKN